MHVGPWSDPKARLAHYRFALEWKLQRCEMPDVRVGCCVASRDDVLKNVSILSHVGEFKDLADVASQKLGTRKRCNSNSLQVTSAYSIRDSVPLFD
jgi:hypothetical protein